jgi:hypothetical protein
MEFNNLCAIHNPWNNLQQPIHASNSITPSLRILLAAIDLGWEVDEPIEVMPTTREDVWTYCFILKHPTLDQTSRIYTSATLEISQFIERNLYEVIEVSFLDHL